MGLAEEAAQGVPDGFIAAGFSNDGGMAEFVATKRLVRGVLMLSVSSPAPSTWPVWEQRRGRQGCQHNPQRIEGPIP